MGMDARRNDMRTTRLTNSESRRTLSTSLWIQRHHKIAETTVTPVKDKKTSCKVTHQLGKGTETKSSKAGATKQVHCPFEQQDHRLKRKIWLWNAKMLKWSSMTFKLNWKMKGNKIKQCWKPALQHGKLSHHLYRLPSPKGRLFKTNLFYLLCCFLLMQLSHQ